MQRGAGRKDESECKGGAGGKSESECKGTQVGRVSAQFQDFVLLAAFDV